MDTSLPANSKLIFKMKKEASDSGELEAFLESAPQFILQSSIVLRTGNISNLLFLLFLLLKNISFSFFVKYVYFYEIIKLSTS